MNSYWMNRPDEAETPLAKHSPTALFMTSFGKNRISGTYDILDPKLKGL